MRTIEEAEAALGAGADLQLNPYSFALKQALARYIQAGERIQKYAKPD